MKTITNTILAPFPLIFVIVNAGSPNCAMVCGAGFCHVAVKPSYIPVRSNVNVGWTQLKTWHTCKPLHSVDIKTFFKNIFMYSSMFYFRLYVHTPHYESTLLGPGEGGGNGEAVSRCHSRPDTWRWLWWRGRSAAASPRSHSCSKSVGEWGKYNSFRRTKSIHEACKDTCWCGMWSTYEAI